MEQQCILRELTAPPTNQQLPCITCPDLDVPFKLKFCLIYLLPKFRGLENKNPHKHMKEFHVVYLGMKLQGVSKEQIKLQTFPFSLDKTAKEWLFYLSPSSITTWVEIMKSLLDHFFPAFRAADIRRKICGIRHRDSESFHDYWEMFKRLCASCL